LKESYLDRAGASDIVLNSIDYSGLTKKVINFIKAKSKSKTPNFSGPDELIQAVTELAFDLAGEAAAALWEPQSVKTAKWASGSTKLERILVLLKETK
jgi:hypothetical protein